MEDTDGERGANGHSRHFCPACQGLEILGQKAVLIYRRAMLESVTLLEGPSVKSHAKIIPTAFHMIGGLLKKKKCKKKELCLMICEDCGFNHCFYWNSMSKLALGCFYDFSPHCRR